MQTLPKFPSREKCRKFVKRFNALGGEVFKPATSKDSDGLWKPSFKGGVLSLKKAS